MKRNNYTMKDAQRSELEEQVMPGGRCVNPEVQKRLYAYISGTLESSEAVEVRDRLLGSSEAEAVEDHLLECRHCREFFLIMESVAGEVRSSHEARPDEESLTRGVARAPMPDDTQKKWP